MIHPFELGSRLLSIRVENKVEHIPFWSLKPIKAFLQQIKYHHILHQVHSWSPSYILNSPSYTSPERSNAITTPLPSIISIFFLHKQTFLFFSSHSPNHNSFAFFSMGTHHSFLLLI